VIISSKNRRIKTTTVAKNFHSLRYIDGLSTFYVRGDGRIIKHRIDRVREKKKKLKNQFIDIFFR